MFVCLCCVYCLFVLCATVTLGQNTPSTEEVVRRVADHILANTSFKFVNAKTHQKYDSTNGLEPSADAGREAAFGKAQYYAQQIVLEGRVHHGDGRRAQRPDQAAQCHPTMHADSLQQQHARILPGEKTQEQDAGAKPVLAGREAQVGVHLQGGEADIHPIERT